MSKKESRFDRTDHWPEHDQRPSRSLCKLCRSTSLTHVFCTKCMIPLCFTRQRNCFLRFHMRRLVNKNQNKKSPPRKNNKEWPAKKMASSIPSAKSPSTRKKKTLTKSSAKKKTSSVPSIKSNMTAETATVNTVPIADSPENTSNMDRELIILTARKAFLESKLNNILKQSSRLELIERSFRVLNTSSSRKTKNSTNHLAEFSEEKVNFMTALHLAAI